VLRVMESIAHHLLLMTRTSKPAIPAALRSHTYKNSVCDFLSISSVDPYYRLPVSRVKT
jgi:hypothetical protein